LRFPAKCAALQLVGKKTPDAWDRAAARLAAEQAEGRRQAQESRRGSSMRTLFELRGRTWVIRPLLLLALAGAAYALTRLFLH